MRPLTYVPSLKGRKECLLVSTQTAIEGTLNVVRQAEKAGITKIVVTGTFGNTIDRKSFHDRISNERELTRLVYKASMGPAFAGITVGDSG